MENSRWKEVQSKVIARAWKDEEFCKKLLTNPKEALKEFGIDLPENVHITAVQEEANHLYFVLPQLPVQAEQLSASELERLAAADCIKTIWGKITVNCPAPHSFLVC